MIDHPCERCEAKAIDRAIICPALGIIDANRCRRIKKHNADDAFDMLYGLRQGAHNTRESIKTRRDVRYMDSELYHIKQVFKGGLSYLTMRKPKRRPAKSIGLTSDALAEGARVETLLETEKALRCCLTDNSGLAPELQA